MRYEHAEIGEEDIHAYVDGALSDERCREVERAMEASPELTARVEEILMLNNTLHARYDSVLDEPIPLGLMPGMTGSAPEIGAGHASDAVEPRPAHAFLGRSAANWSRMAGLAAMLAVGVGIGIGIGSQRLPRAGDRDSAGTTTVALDTQAPFAREAALAHVVYMPDIVRPENLGVDHEQEFVQTLADRLGTDVHPPMLTRDGFELAGGRLLSDTNGGVAQFMYRDAKGQRVTVCISRRIAPANATAFRLYQDGSVNVFYWVDGDFGYAVSGGINRQVLLELAHDVHAQLLRAGRG